MVGIKASIRKFWLLILSKKENPKMKIHKIIRSQYGKCVEWLGNVLLTSLQKEGSSMEY